MARETDDADALIDALTSDLSDCSGFLIGIDGIDGAGKSQLGRRLSTALHVPLVSLDDFLEEHRGTYVEHLRMPEIAELIRMPRAVVEGICLLSVMEKVGLSLTRLIYLKRLGPYGDWRDRDVCDPQEPVEQVITHLDEQAKKFSQVAAQLEGEDESESDEAGLTPLRKEIITYHARYRPHLRADYVLQVFPEGRLPADACHRH